MALLPIPRALILTRPTLETRQFPIAASVVHSFTDAAIGVDPTVFHEFGVGFGAGGGG